MKRSRKDQLTGGSHDTNPHYRSVEFVFPDAIDVGGLNRQHSLGIKVPAANLNQVIAVSQVQTLELDTGITTSQSPNMGPQTVMEITDIEIDNRFQPNTFRPVYPNAEPASTVDSDSAAFATRQMKFSTQPFSFATNVQLGYSAISVGNQANEPLGMFAKWKEEYQIESDVQGNTSTQPGIENKTFWQHREDEDINLNDDAGHGYLVATPKIYIAAEQFLQMVSSVANAFAEMGLESMRAKIYYRWKTISYTQYLGILTSQTLVN